MIISVCGSQGQGKSTVLQNLEDRGFFVIKNKTARTILNDWNSTLERVYSDKDMCVKFHEQILYRHSQLCENYINSADVHFIERSYADIFSYALAVLGPFNAYSDWLNEFYAKCKKQQQDFASVIYLTGRKYTPESDGVRSTNKHFSARVDSSIEAYLTDFSEAGIVFTVSDKSIDDRVSKIVDICHTYFGADDGD